MNLLEDLTRYHRNLDSQYLDRHRSLSCLEFVHRQVSENANCDGYESTSMVQPVARIRPFQVSDDKDVRFAIGKGSLESLAVANRKSQSKIYFLFFFLTKNGNFQPTSIL